MNEYIINLRGKASLPQELSIGNNYKVVAEGAITEEKKSDKDDGDFIITYKFEPVLVTIENDKGQRIKAKDTRRRSQQLRATLFRVWQARGDVTDFDEWYDKKMLEFISKALEE